MNHALHEKSVEAALGRIAGALRQYLRDRMDIKAAALTTEGTLKALRKNGVSEVLAEEVADLIETSELARFNSAVVQDGTVRSLAKRARKAIQQLEASV